jgi:hypothetical protein
MPYRQRVLETVKKENHDKPKRGWKCVIKCINNVAIKYIFISHRIKTRKCNRRDVVALYWSCLILKLPDTEVAWYWSCLILKLPDSEVALYWSCLILKLPDSEVAWHWSCLILKLPYTEVAFYWSCLILKLPYTEVAWYWSCLILKLSDTEVALYWSCLVLKLPYNEAVSTFQRSLFWKMSLKKITWNAIMVDGGFYRSTFGKGYRWQPSETPRELREV